MGYSKEDAAILNFLKNSGVAFTPPSPQQINEGEHVAGSYHYRVGTQGIGLAIDLVGPSLLNIFNVFDSVYTHLEELIWNNHAAQGRNVKNGKHVAIYDTVANASNHIHVAVNVGTFLDQLGGTPVNTGAPYIAHCRFKSSKTNDWASAALHADGAVFCDPPEAYQGGANGQSYFRGPARDIHDNHQGGYTILGKEDIDKYAFPSGTNPNG